MSDANCVNVQNDQLILTVSPLPTAEATVSANQVCLDSAEPTVTFTGSLGTAPYTFDYSVNGGPVQQVVSAAGVSNVEFTATTSSVGTYQAELISVTDANGCFQAIGQVVSITIVSPPTIPAIAELHVCDDNNDGIGCFDLTATIASITGGDPNLTVSFHETEDDAINNANPIAGTTYCNPNPAQQQIFVNVYYTGAPDCAAQAPVQLFIDPRPVPLNPIPAYTLCDYTTPGDATEEFDLSTMNAAILNGQTGIDVTYYASQDDALVPQNPIGPLYTSGNNTIWVRLENAASGCFAVSSFQLIVNPLPSITPYGPVTLCSDGVSDTASFPLNEYSNFISGGVPGTAVSYHLTLALAQSGEDPLPSPYVTSDATIYVRLENVATNCEVTTELVLNVEDGPAITQPDPLSQCDPNNDGIATFNLTDAVAQITGGIAGMTVTFHETEFDAQNGVNPIAPATAYANIEAFEQTIHIRVTSDLTGCPSYATLTLIVKPTPEANENTDPLQECDTDGDAQAFFDLASAIPNILNGLDAAAHSVRFWPTAADAANGTNEIAGIDAYLSVSTTIFVTVSTLDADTPCTDTVELELIVNPLPIVPFSITPIITLCDQVTPDDQVEIFDLTSVIPLIVGSQTGLEVTFYRNQADALAGANAITTPAAFANETPAVQTIWITVTSVATGCQALTTMDIRVEPLPSPILPALDDPRTNLCDANQDGYAEFDLDALILDMQQGVPPAQMVITFHETQEDAENGANAVSSPYVNDVPFTDTIYIRALNTETGCQRVLALTLNVTPAPVIPATLTPSPLETCDTLGDDQDGIATFDLTVYESQILAAQTAPGSYTVEYFTSLAAAQDGTLPIINPAQYQGTTGEIWYNVVGSTNECFNTGSFLIQVNAPLDVPVSLGIWSACDDQPLASGILTLPWDLTNLPATLAIPNLPGDAVVTFYPSPALAQQGTGAIPAGDLTAFVNTSNAQTIGISIVTAQGCISYTTLTLKVLPPPTVVTLTQDQDLHECDTDATPGTEEFDLTVNEEFMANNDTDLVFSYYLTQEDAEVPVNPIAIPTQHTSATGSVWVRAERPSSSDVDGEFCHVIQELKLFVDELPLVIATPLTLPGCAAAGSPTAVFDLTGLNDQILLAPQDPANYTFTYYTDAALTSEISNPAAYTGTDLQDIWVVVSNIATDCNSVSAQLILDVQEAAVATQPEDPAAICADAASTDGTTHVFDLTLLDAEIIGTQDPVQFTIAYFATIEDAIDHINPIATPAAYEAATGSVFAVVTNTASAAPCRSAIIEIPLVVEPLLQVAIAGENILCVTYPDLTPIAPGTLLEVTGVANPADYTFEWYLDGAALGVTTPTYYAQAAGDYTVNVISNSLNCVSTTAVHTITLSSPPVALSPSYTVTDAFQDTQTITINVAGVNPADYQYAIDGGALQSSPVFTNVGLGEHTVRVVGYCDEITIGDVFIIDYPHYFTPNGDGIHDTWNISWPTTQASPKIYIFDRYGKLLKQIHAPGDGWDGTFNGHLMPSTDYWFQVIYTENGVEKEFKAHFALKR
ncbi:MAG: T9SS type B sorting domain-containing protein [Sphingobacteriales bacterium]|nr:MAG: T9SS type B sorting domain-containing protein [Sphingobacteriales bacterium]